MKQMRITFKNDAVLAVAVFIVGVLAACSVNGRAPFGSCDEARAAGVHLPLTPDSPGWNSELDRDRDGKAC